MSLSLCQATVTGRYLRSTFFQDTRLGTRATLSKILTVFDTLGPLRGALLSTGLLMESQSHTIPSRKIPDEVWDDHRPEISELYMQTDRPMTLNALRKYFQTNHGFNPSEKQWKDHLTRWNLKRNLDAPTAAIILWLYRDAEQKGVSRIVLHQGRSKTRSHIQRYISKSKDFSNETDLLRKLPDRANWPGNIRWKDVSDRSQPQVLSSVLPRAPVNGPSTALTAPTTSGLEDTLPSSLSHIPCDGASFDPEIQAPGHFDPRGDTSPYNNFSVSSNVLLPGHHIPLQNINTGYELPPFVYDHLDPFYQSQCPQPMDELYYPHTDRAGVQLLQQDETFDSWPETPALGSGLQHLSQPGGYHEFPRTPSQFSSAEDVAAGKFTASFRTHHISFHRLCSVTPIRLPLSPDNAAREKQIEAVLARLLGKDESLQHQPARRFAKLCFQAVIFDGQEEQDRCSLTIDAAVQSFNDIMADNRTWPMILQTLNRMSFLLEIYGQKELKAWITDSLIQNLRHHEEGMLFVVKGTLEFVHNTASWNKDKSARSVPTTRAISQRATEITTKNSPFALCASYNAGWALLEAGHYDEAIQLFTLGRSHVENVFGPYALETISWIGTLARAHFRNKDYSTAELLMRETVLVRAEEAYTQDHAIYWEVKYRIGLFYMQMAEINCRPEKTQEYWGTGESLMREALRWRASELGPDNPQTTAAHNCLKDYLIQQEKTEEADGLFDWYRKDTIS